MKRNASVFVAAMLVYAAALSMAQGTAKAAMISKAEAQAIALNHAGFTVDQVSRLTVRYDIDDGRPKYEVDIYLTNRSGEILDLRIEEGQFFGTLEGGKMGGSFSVKGAKNH